MIIKSIKLPWMALAPFAHQGECFELGKDKRAFGFFMEQGTGKSKAFLDKTVHLFLLDKIDAAVVIAPNGVHRNWIELEVPKHVTIPHDTFLWTGETSKRFMAAAEAFLEPKPGERRLKIFAVNIEALQRKTSRVIPYIFRFMRKFRTHLGVDESSQIKTPSATRTRTVIRLGPKAEARAVLTGTSVTTGPFNLYSQFQFLKPGSLGFANFTAFKAYYAEWKRVPHPAGKRVWNTETGKLDATIPELVEYRHLDELKRLVATMSYTCRKDDCLDLPPKVYLKRPVEMSESQAKLYAKVKQQVLIELQENRTLTIRQMLSRMMRLSQVTGGFEPSDQEKRARPIEGTNPKITSLLGIVDELDPEDKIIVWARFVPELELITRVIDDNYSGGVSRWWGAIKEEVRGIEKYEFQNDPKRRFFVGQQHSGGYGNDLFAANHVAYFSNDFSLEARVQSEDRAHRIGQTRKVTYHDLLMTGTIDHKVMTVLKAQRDMADYFKTPLEAVAWLT